MPKVNNWIEFIQDLIYPPTCLLCGDPGDDGLDLCHACHRELPWLIHACPRCALPLSGHSQLCGNCLKHPPPFERTRALWRYQAPVSGVIAALKFRGHRPCARFLGELLARNVADAPRPDCLVPVPLHPSRLRQRGFNQSLAIAHIIASRLDIPLRPRLCRRIRATPPQRELDARQRRTNLQGAFQATDNLRGLHLALIDDVMTTGATAAEVAKTLRTAGAATVEVWVPVRA